LTKADLIEPTASNEAPLASLSALHSHAAAVAAASPEPDVPRIRSVEIFQNLNLRRVIARFAGQRCIVVVSVRPFHS
jgi:hypothetical protein